LAFKEVTSNWVFLNDDDNRFEPNLIDKVLDKAHQFGCKALTTAYLQPNEKQSYTWIHQSGIFGSGNSFVKRDAINDVFFDIALEFGYGEDTDFGLQLRNKGYDIIYFPDLKITHLKAPMGGFRIPVTHPWQDQEVQPKPSPTMMYVFMKYYTMQQLASYKVVLFLKLIKKVSPLKYLSFHNEFKQKWEMSQYWARKLGNEKR
jgi:GT2 family glycosyltransferase